MTVLISKDEVREPLYVVVPVSNPWRWKSRYKHTDRAIKHFIDSGAIVYLVEVAFNRREFVYADAGIEDAPVNCRILNGDPKYKHKYIGLRSASELWHKECQVNLAIAHIPYDWQQVAWIDSDVMFLRPNWVGTTVQLLQHYDLLQLFSHARDLDPEYTMLPEDYPHSNGHSFIHAWHRGILYDEPNSKSDSPRGYPYPPRVWPGVAWAATRRAYDALGQLFDVAVWGGADFHMSWALIGNRTEMMHPELHESYKKLLNEWFDRAQRHIRQNVGVMSGSIVHQWHGPKWARGYGAKHRLLAEIGFDPLRHLKRDFQGLWMLNDDGSDAYMTLRDTMRQIARARNEDSNDTRMDLFDKGWGH